MSRVDNIISRVKKNGTEKKKSRVEDIIERSSNGNLETGVDEKYIDSFINDFKDYISNFNEDYKNVGYNNASSFYEKYSSKSSDLGSRANTIRAHLNSNKNNLDEDIYNQLISTLDDFEKNRNFAFNQMRRASEYYSKWDTEEEYNADVETLNKYYEKWGHYADAEDFGATSANRNFKNPTDEDFLYYDAMMNTKTWYTDAYGKMYDAFGNEIPYVADANGIIRHPLENDSRFSVTDPLGLFLSTPEDERETLVNGTQSGKKFETLREGVVNHWEMLKDDEVSLYYSILNKEGQDKALEYLRDTAEKLNSRWGADRVKEIQGIDNGFIRTLSTGVLGLEAGLDQWSTGVAQIIEGESLPTSGVQYASAEMSNSLEGLGKYAYDATVTVGNMLPSILTSKLLGAAGIGAKFAQGVGAATVGISAGGNAYGQALKEGYGESQAQTYGVLVGASEAALQYLIGGIGSLGGVTDDILLAKTKMIDSSLLRLSAKFGIKLGSEVAEEELQNFLEPAFRTILFGEDYDAPTIDEIVETAIVTALSTGVLEGGSTIATDFVENRQLIDHGKDIMKAEGGVDALRELALDIVQNSSKKTQNDVSKLADKVSGEKVKAGNVGRLYQATTDAATEQNKADIVKSLERKGYSSKEASSIADALVTYYTGEDLTKKQYKKVESLENDENFLKTVNDVVLNNVSTAGQRSANLDKFDIGIANGIGISTDSAKTRQNIRAASLKKEIAESEFEVSAEGKTINTKTGAIVNIQKIDSISESGEANLTLEGGMVVKASDLAYGNDAEALLVENIGKMKLGNKSISTASANALYQIAKTSITPDMKPFEVASLIKGLEESYVHGVYNFGSDKLTDSNAVAFANELTEEQRKFAYELGSQDRASEVERSQKVIDDLKAKGKPSKKSLGKIIFEKGAEVDESTLTKTQKANLNGIKLLAELSSVEFHIFKSEKVGKTFKYTMPDGTVVSANGWYVAGTNEIWVDLNAGNFGEGTMIRTAAHEISHYIKQWSPKKWQAMADLLMEEFAKNGVNTESMLNRQIAKIKRRYSKENMPSEAKLLDMAYEELVSDALSDMLTDGSIVNFMAEVKAKDRTLWQKIKDAIENLLKKWGLIIEDYKGRSLDTAEAQALSQLEDTFKKLQAMYQEAFIDANEAVATIGARNLADFSEAKNTEGESLFQYRAMEADEATYREMLRKWGKMSDAQINNLFTTIDKAMDIIKDNLEVLDYAWESDIDDRAFSPVKPNSDSLYQVSLDFSTLCRKRLLQQTIQAQLQEALNQPLTREEGIAIRDALVALQEEGRQIEVACALCYVESARMKSPAQIKKFLNNRDKVLKDFFAGKSGGTMKAKIDQAVADAREKLHKENPNGIKGKDGSMLDPRTAPLKAMSGKYANTIRDAKKAAKESYKPTAKEQELIDIAKDMTVSDFTTPEGLENLAKNYPALFDAYTSYVRNATKSKGIEGDTWWRAGDSQNIGDVLIANMNRENGLRSQSWSDFQVIHILDYIAATIELSTRNAKEQAYSKVPDYVELMGQTGVMINMSLIPTRDFYGELEYDPTEGIDYNRALALREKYPATAGTICIGIDNKQIQMLLADITIDYVIPYHKSGMAASVRKLMHMPTWSEYEDYQSEKTLSREDAEAQAKKYGVTLLAESDPNYHKHTSFSEWFNLKEAKQIAKMENANPTNKAMQEKYGVMYGGYVAMQNAANNYLKLCAERGISPKFSHDKADFTSEDNYWKLLIDRKMVNNATGEIIEQQAIKPIFDEGEVLRILNDELERYPSVKADQDYATRKVTEKFLSGEIKSGMSAEAIAKVMKTPVDNIAKTNILASEGEIEDFDSSDKLFSDRDSSGRELSKGQQKYFAKSKVRDRYGKLLRLYHGSAQGGFTIFDPKKSDDTLCLFLTDTIEMAESYSGSRKPIRTPSPKPNILRWLDGGTKKAGKQQGVYEVYANITNPMVIEAKGRNFNQLSVDAPNTKDVNLKVAGYENDMRIEITIGKENYVEYFYNFDEAMDFVARKLDKGERSRLKAAFFKGGFINIDTNFKWDTERNQRVPYLDIRDIAKIAKERGHDGVIVRDVTDYDNRYGIPEKTPHGTVVVAFKSNQIKDVHNTNPTKRKDIRYSDRDSEGNTLSEGQQEFFKDSEVRDKDGNLLVVYHGSPKGNTTIFDKSKTSKDNDMGQGVYFSTNISDANEYRRKTNAGDMGKSYRGKVYSAYVNIKNPFVVSESENISLSDALNLLKLCEDRIAAKDVWYNLNINAKDGYVTTSQFANSNISTHMTDILAKSNKYDGIIDETVSTKFGLKEGTKHIVVISPEQIKAIDNKNPTTDPDIRYSERDTSTSNRSILANSLENAAQNDIERNKLAQYKEKIALIESEEQRLSEIQKQLFTKGGVDPAQRKDLQFEAKQIANRITTYDRQLLNLEATTALKNVLSREKALAMKRQKQKDAEAMRQYKEKVAKTTRELMARNQESRKKAIEGREKTAMRHKIKNVVSELNQLLLRGTKDKHVMIGLQKAVAEALDAVNMDTVGAEERVAHYNDLIAKAKDPDIIASLTATRDRIQAQGDKMSDKLTKLKNAYNDIKNSDDPLIANSHDEVIASRLEYIAEKVGNTPLRDMSLEQLEDVYDMYKMVLTTIRNSNKSFKNAKNESIATLGNRVMMEVEKVGGKKQLRRKGTEGIEKFAWNNLKPTYAFSRIGSDTLTEVFNNVRAGEDTWAIDVTEAREYYLEQSKKHNYDSWDFKKRYKFTSTSGMDFELSLEQIMSLYAYSKREQAAEHLRKGGIVFDETTEVTIKNKLGIPMKFNPTEATAYNLSVETLADIVGKLTNEQRAFVDEMQAYLSDVMGEKGNAVSLVMYGVKLFKEKFYFPLKSATQFMAKAKEQQQGEVKIKNSGFSKETVQKASNPIVLTPFMDVWANHVNEMSMYHAFVLSMEDFYRVFNYKTPTSDTMATESVEMFIQNAYGKGATQYIEQLLKDLNGGAISDPRETFSKALMSKFKKAAVMASLSVVVQQPTAMIRAMALVDMRHFGIAPISRGIVRTVIPKKHKALWSEVKKYAPVAIIKEMGRFDTHMGQSVQDFIKAEEYKGFNKVKGFAFDSNYRDDVLSKVPALADEMAWVAIWEAVKRETVSKHKDLKPNSEEFLKVVGERFTEVITKTQVYDSVLSRSANMRAKSAFMSMWTSFMAEPTTSINMLEDALRQGKRGNKKYAAKAIGAVYGSVVLNAALVSLVYAMRDDDEDETFLEKYASRLTTELLDGINPLTYIPFLKDIWSISQGFDIERADMSLVADLVDTLQQTVTVISKDTTDMDEEELAEHQWEVAGALGSIADSISSLVGLPIKNVRRDINGAINLFGTLVKDANGRKTSAGSLLDEVWEDVKSSIPVVGWLPNETKGDKFYDAIVNGDTAYVDRLKSGYKDDKAYESAVRKALRENDSRIREAAEARIDGDIAEYTRIVKDIKGEGFFSQDTIVASVNAEINALSKGEDSSSSSDKAKSMYKIDDYFMALDGGDEATAYVVKEDLIETDVANGKDREEAEESFNGKFASYLREQYEEGNLSESEAQRMLVNYGEKTEEEAASKVQYWEFKQDYPDYDDLSEEAVAKYYEKVEPYGITVDVYYDYSKQRSKCKGTDNNGDGKTDSGSVKAEVLWVIHSLPLTYAQKDALYYLNGWSAKTIYEAPWH